MKAHRLDNEQCGRDDLDWLSQRMINVTQEETQYFCRVLKDALARDWMLLDARNYALGRLIGHGTSFLVVRSAVSH